MTDNEIIKALECCINSNCGECPMISGEDCNLDKLTLGLINRQKAEIERYEKEHKENFDKWDRLAERTKNHYEELYQEAKAAVREGAIKEFAERLASTLVNTPFGVNCSGETDDYRNGCLRGLVEKQNNVLCVIDNLVKEMVGEADG